MCPLPADCHLEALFVQKVWRVAPVFSVLEVFADRIKSQSSFSSPSRCRMWPQKTWLKERCDTMNECHNIQPL